MVKYYFIKSNGCSVKLLLKSLQLQNTQVFKVESTNQFVHCTGPLGLLQQVGPREDGPLLFPRFIIRSSITRGD